jgi:hypothetical protein
VSTRVIDLRIALEDGGATLSTERGKLLITEPLGGIAPELAASARAQRKQLATLVALYPCRSCARARDPFGGRCDPCPGRQSRDPKRRDRVSVGTPTARQK